MAPGLHAAVLLPLLRLRLLPAVLQCRAAAWREYERCARRESPRAGEAGEAGAAHDSVRGGLTGSGKSGC